MAGLSTLSERFSHFFIDQFGVLHDGSRPYPGAIEALKRLKTTGASILLLSNSGRPAHDNVLRLERLGFPRDCYDAFVTSGDLALDLVERGALPVTLDRGTRCLTISGVGERSLATALGFEDAADGETADVVIIAGSRGDIYPIETYRDLLRPAAARGAPALCTNPDKIMLTPGGPAFGAGRIAELYKELGGTVTYIGKPYPEMYARALGLSGCTDPSEIACIGDSVEHDIVGAKRFGAFAVLVRTGLNEGNSDGALEEKYQRFGVRPDMVLPAFRW